MTETRPKLLAAGRLGWFLCALAWLLPFIIIYGFIKPYVGQAYFFELGICVAVFWAAGACLFGTWRPAASFTPPIWLLIINFALLGVSVFRSRDPAYSFELAVLPICFCFFCMLLVMLPGRRQLLKLLGLGLCVIGPVLAIYGILQHFHIEFLPYSEKVQKNRVIATIGHPNYLGSVLGPLIFVLVGYILAHPRRVWAALAPIGVGAMLFCLALARTRAIWLGLFSGFIIFFAVGILYCRLRHAGTRRLLMLTFGGLAQIALVILALNLSGVNLKERLASDTEVKSRLFYWDTAIALGNQQPALGQGYGMFNAKFWETALERYKQPNGVYYADLLSSIAGVMPGHVHNEYLEVFCEQGWTGFITFALLLLFFLWFGLRSLLSDASPERAFEMLGVWAALIVTSIDAMFGFPWRLPVSLMVVGYLLVRLYDQIYPQEVVEAPEVEAASPAMPATTSG